MSATVNYIDGVSVTITVSPLEILALKKLGRINRALAQSLKDTGAQREQETLMRVLVDVTGRLDLAAQTKAKP